VEERTDLGGHQAPHGPQPEAYDAECAALARALESVSGEYVPERVTIFTDAQAAIRRMASEEPGPGQQYAIQARKHIATLRRARPGITIEVRWCPAHEGIAGNEKADEWAKIAAEKPGTRGVEYPGSLPRSLANLKREISEKKWTEARSWARGRISKAKYRMPKSQKPDGAVGRQHQEACLEVLPAEDGARPHRTVPALGEGSSHSQCWWCLYPSQTRDHLFKVCPE